MEIPVCERKVVIKRAREIMEQGHDPLTALKMAEQELEKQKKMGGYENE